MYASGKPAANENKSALDRQNDSRSQVGFKKYHDQKRRHDRQSAAEQCSACPSSPSLSAKILAQRQS